MKASHKNDNSQIVELFKLDFSSSLVSYEKLLILTPWKLLAFSTWRDLNVRFLDVQKQRRWYSLNFVKRGAELVFGVSRRKYHW